MVLECCDALVDRDWEAQVVAHVDCTHDFSELQIPEKAGLFAALFEPIFDGDGY